MSSLEQMPLDDLTPSLVMLRSIIDDYVGYTENVKKLIREGQNIQIYQLIDEDGILLLQAMDLLNEIIDFEIKIIDETIAWAKDDNHRANAIFVLVLAVGLLTGGGISLWMLQDITSRMNQLTVAMQQVTSHSDKTSLPRLPVIARDEIGEIAVAFNAMADDLEQYTKREKVYYRVMEEQNWLKTNLGHITALFQGVEDIKILSKIAISQLTPMVEASFGVFYLLEGEGEERRPVRMADYAAGDGNRGWECFSAGGDLALQCALEKKTILLTDVPKQHITVNSGLGAAVPQSIILVPIEFEGQVLAVVEMATFKEFSPLQQMLISQVGRNIGIALNRIGGYMQVQKLLAESQALTEKLQAQSHQLRKHQEELMLANEKLDKQYHEAEKRAAELEAAQLELKEKARQLALSSRYKSEFLSNMSHELRTPLNSLMILARLLADNKEGNLTAKQMEYAETIYSSGNDLLDLINDILDLSRLEAGKMQIKPEYVSLAEVKKDLERYFMPVARKKKVDFLVELESGLPKTIYTDRHRLMQILKNLISNALKFTERGHVHLVICGANNKDFKGQLAFSVSDTGIGIAGDRQHYIFEAFRQLDGTTSRKYGGTGLGLSICRQLADLLGGHVELTSSEVGKGSTFTFYLPPCYGDGKTLQDASDAEEKTAAAVDDKAARCVDNSDILQGCKVLVVDDDMRNVFSITAALEEQKMEVVFAENGLECLKVLNHRPDIDIVLMDIMMSGMDGYQAIKNIRKMDRYKDLPIIAITAKAMKGDREKCLAVGASDYISKPLDIHQLLSVMRAWISEP